jgi:hypothetical protein
MTSRYVSHWLRRPVGEAFVRSSKDAGSDGVGTVETASFALLEPVGGMAAFESPSDAAHPAWAAKSRQ